VFSFASHYCRFALCFCAFASQYQELLQEQKRLEQQFAKLVEEDEASNLALRKRRNHAKAELSKSIAQYDRDMLEVTGKIEVRAPTFKSL
jgi:deoxyribodipyrimidine photolyase-like uncharacterized protein